MPPTASSSGAKSKAEPELAGLIEQERLPRSRGDLSQPLVAGSQTERILVAMAKACAANGYGATTIGDIVEAAGVSRATFYELFSGKEECLEAAMELALADAMSGVTAAYSPGKPWAEMIGDATASFLGLLAARPEFARMALIEAPAASERSQELYAGGKRVLLALLDRGRGEGAVEDGAIPASAGRSALAAAESLIAGQILAGNTERLPELLPDVVYILTIPYLGQDEALRRSREAEQSLHSEAS